MRKLAILVCSTIVGAALASLAGATAPNAGTLSVEHGSGVVMLDLRGSVLGRLSSGVLRVTDLTPNDRYSALVVGTKVAQDRGNGRTVVYRGQGLRFRMLGGGYRVLVRGVGIDLSAVGRGVVLLAADARSLEDDPGLYSFDGIDCELEPSLCTPLPAEPQRFALGLDVSGTGTQ